MGNESSSHMNSGKEIRCIVTDLDDTIWDWLTMWHSSFEPFLTRIQREFGIPRRVVDCRVCSFASEVWKRRIFYRLPRAEHFNSGTEGSDFKKAV